MIRALYQALTLLGAPLLVPFFLASKRGRARLGERFGAWGTLPAEFLWLHGASLGEINGIIPLLEEILCRSDADPGKAPPSVVVTATSVSGLERILAHPLGPRIAATRLLPFDNHVWIDRALGKSKPFALVIGETELWPGLLDAMKLRGVPVAIVNARISERAFARYHRLRRWIEPSLKSIRLICAQTPEARERFVALGVPKENAIFTGNSKYDSGPALVVQEEILALKRQFFPESCPVLVLGSLRPGEEEEWFPLLVQFWPRLRGRVGIVIAPRHSEKFEFFAERLRAFDLPFIRRSDMSLNAEHERPLSADLQKVVLLDTMGELSKIYSFASVAFIGGTLRPYGGHNPFEPTPYGAAIALGRFCSNAQDAVQLLREGKGLFEIQDRTQIAALLEALLAGGEGTTTQGAFRLSQIGANGCEVWRNQRGAVHRIADALVASGFAV